MSRAGTLTAFALLAVFFAAASAGAATTTERSASILIFPKVIVDGTRDTLIQISNTNNSMVHAHCFYVNGAPTFPEFPPDPIRNPPRWVEIDRPELALFPAEQAVVAVTITLPAGIPAGVRRITI